MPYQVEGAEVTVSARIDVTLDLSQEDIVVEDDYDFGRGLEEALSLAFQEGGLYVEDLFSPYGHNMVLEVSGKEVPVYIGVQYAEGMVDDLYLSAEELEEVE